MRPTTIHTLATAAVWTTVMLGSAIVLMGTSYLGTILIIQAGGAFMSLFVVGGALRRLL